MILLNGYLSGLFSELIMCKIEFENNVWKNNVLNTYSYFEVIQFLIYNW